MFQKVSLAALAAAALVTAGCFPERFGNDRPIVVQPVPIQAAPLGQVSQETLPPPGGFPAGPGMAQQTQVPGLGAAPAGGIALTPASVAGVWRASIDGMTCQVATPQTKYGRGYRAGPLRCPAAFSRVNSWTINGSQLVFYDGSGSLVATLVSPDGSRFEGRTASGIPVTLSR